MQGGCQDVLWVPYPKPFWKMLQAPSSPTWMTVHPPHLLLLPYAAILVSPLHKTLHWFSLLLEQGLTPSKVCKAQHDLAPAFLSSSISAMRTLTVSSLAILVSFQSPVLFQAPSLTRPPCLEHFPSSKKNSLFRSHLET